MASPEIRPIRAEGQLAYISLTMGYVAVIDAADVPLVSGGNWCAEVRPHGVYARRCEGSGPRKRVIRLHRLLMAAPMGHPVDHINGDGLDNRRANLRLATVQQNNHNRRRTAMNTSGFKGVHLNRQLNKWRAMIKVSGKQSHLGYFDTPEDAAVAYAKASAKLHGEYGRTQ